MKSSIKNTVAVQPQTIAGAIRIVKKIVLILLLIISDYHFVYLQVRRLNSATLINNNIIFV